MSEYEREREENIRRNREEYMKAFGNNTLPEVSFPPVPSVTNAQQSTGQKRTRGRPRKGEKVAPAKAKKNKKETPAEKKDRPARSRQVCSITFSIIGNEEYLRWMEGNGSRFTFVYGDVFSISTIFAIFLIF